MSLFESSKWLCTKFFGQFSINFEIWDLNIPKLKRKQRAAVEKHRDAILQTLVKFNSIVIDRIGL